MYKDKDIIIIIIIIIGETIDHIISACPILAKEQYTKRYDRVCVCPTTLQHMQGNGYNWTKNTGMNMYKIQ